MTPETFLTRIVEPTLAYMAASPTIAVPRSKNADVLLTTIAGQESHWEHRRQIGIGQYYPQKVGARGYWQFESTWAGPVALNDVMVSTKQQLETVCKLIDIPYDEYSLYEACAWNDTLACAMARLLLWIHPARLPAIGDKEAAWQYYLRQWRPGTPHRQTWDGYYDQAVTAVGG
jgi:hypothetical protein